MIINKKLATISILLMVLSGYAYYVFGQTWERIVWAGAVAFAVFAIEGFTDEIMIEKSISGFVYFLFILSFVLDSLLTLSIRPLIYGGAMAITYWICIVLMRQVMTDSLFDVIFWISIVWTVVVVVVSLSGGVGTAHYSGIFVNPNTFGIFMESMFTVLISYYAHKAIENRALRIYDYFLIIACAILIIVSSCRIAIGTMLVQLGLFLILALSKRQFDQKQVWITAATILALIVVLLIVSGHFSLFTIFQDSFVSKFKMYSDQGDITDGRMVMWKAIIEKSGLIGDGNKAYVNFRGLEAHNTYLGLANQYGKINAVLFLIFVVINGIETLIAALRSDAGKWRFLPLMSAVGFAMVSMTENFLMTMPMLMFFFSIPLCKYYGEKK